MHEVGIANSVLEKARSEAGRFPGAKLLRVGVRIGEWSGVEPESLRFCFEALVAGTGAPAPALDIEFCLRRNRCPQCGHVFRVEHYVMTCPDCGETNTMPFSGDELQITYIDLEES
jgi:hydrogenase nickel incorporation protein HypA/HybF